MRKNRMKIHYFSHLFARKHPTKNTMTNWSACGHLWLWVLDSKENITEDTKKVTCGNCKRTKEFREIK